MKMRVGIVVGVLGAALGLGFGLTGKAAAAGLRSPTLQSPGNRASVQSLPAFTWASVRGATYYDFEFAADPRFTSGVTGFGQGANRLSDTAITSDKTIPDGTYYWRVRGVTAKDHAGPWSATRLLHKAWTDAPTLLNPMSGTTAWPTNPLVLNWTAVPHAVKYDVWVATDPGLSNLISGPVKSPTWTEATNLALSTALTPGTYYWAITPVDAEGNLGQRSQIGSFTWTWPSATSVNEANASLDPGVVDPQFSWATIPGATSYQVEINSSPSFPPGSDWCCSDKVLGNSLTPTQFLPNETTLYWRMRALDSAGDAGQWNTGQPFTESFDQLNPTIPNLTLRDVNGNGLASGAGTQTPIVTWDAVPGASSYEVQVTPHQTLGCDWSSASIVLDVTTATTAWTPFASGKRIGPSAWPSFEGGDKPYPPSSGSPGVSYCLRVAARRDDAATGGSQIVSDWTQLGGTNAAAFVFLPESTSGTLTPTPASAYVLPGPAASSPTVTSTPLFTWNAVPGAAGYYVVVSRDACFTDVVDVGFTRVTAYAPRIANKAPYADETDSYYYAIVPAANADGSGVFTDPECMSGSEDNPQAFTKSSTPSSLVAPVGGASATTDPTFSWTSAQGARNYTLQIDTDPSFSTPLLQVTTDSTSYTVESTLPAGNLYWRVRANDVAKQGLNWSATATFSHTLPVPSPSPSDPRGGETLPVFAWTAEDGAVGYDIHFVQADGTTKDFTTQGPVGSWQYWYGTGIWRWQVRADYPGNVSSAYFSPQMPFVRVETPPRGAYGTKSGNRIVISWNSDPNAKQYKVQLSTTDGFGSTVASDTTDNTVWVPQITSSTAAHTLYWRAATIDWGGNVGAYATGVFNAPRSAKKPRACKRSKHHRCPTAPRHMKQRKKK
jgi:hypothetical protein